MYTFEDELSFLEQIKLALAEKGFHVTMDNDGKAASLVIFKDNLQVYVPSRMISHQKINPDYLGEFEKAYLVAALWTQEDYIGHKTIHDFSDEALAHLVSVCEKFQNDNKELLEQFYENKSKEDAGHNFWMNQNRHGSGFWDETGISKELGAALSEACHKFPEQDIELGDDGQVHI